MTDDAYDEDQPRADEVDPVDQSGRPFLVSGFVLVLLATLLILALVGVFVLR